ncbi:MAG: ATP-binding cassette domain-containing protein [Candidatus Woesebacteria bacterium]|nr:ATP-binding cassette domain-containing protein [Candidatus Woesebacteria bacterium]
MDKAIIVDRLSSKVLKKISFAIQAGEIVGIIGPNGAGKTTTMKVLSGISPSTSGFVSVLDFDPYQRNQNFLKQISFVTGQKTQLWWNLPATETFELNKALYQIPEREYKKNLDQLISLFNVSKILKIPVNKLSPIQRAKMEMIASLIHKPKILFLDEPLLKDFVFDYNREYGTTILLSSSYIGDFTDLLRRIIIINKGTIIFDGAIEEITTKFATEKIIKATLSEEVDIKLIGNIGTVKRYSFPQIYISVPRTIVTFAAAELLQNYPVVNLEIEEFPIEEIIKNITN